MIYFQINIDNNNAFSSFIIRLSQLLRCAVNTMRVLAVEGYVRVHFVKRDLKLSFFQKKNH